MTDTTAQDAGNPKPRVGLAGIAEIQNMLVEISIDRVQDLTCREDFPKPMAALGEGDVWFRDDIEAWLEQHDAEALAGMLRNA